MNKIVVNDHLTVEFEDGLEIEATDEKIVVRKAVAKLAPLAPPMRPLIPRAFPVVK